METNQIILTIFAVAYLGIAIGHIPGLMLNRIGIALLGAMGMMIFGGCRFVRELADDLSAVRFFCHLRPAPVVGVL
ncbi:MAG TPA: hypothetical protein VK742_11395 [Candidatus Sulfotelmatobacter sp.]|jgi:hypothetical protein|nr:hypothetical protein [Candidatus Sulfotelmatobacter sp.]